MTSIDCPVHIAYKLPLRVFDFYDTVRLPLTARVRRVSDTHLFEPSRRCEPLPKPPPRVIEYTTAPPEPTRSGQVTTVTSRPGRPFDDDDVIHEGASRHRQVTYLPTPPFVVIGDNYPRNEVAHASPVPHLKAKPLPPTTSMNRSWFNPSWIAENERPDVEHGEFQSPVWLCVEMTMRADRERDAHESVPRHARHATAGTGEGQLRTLLAFVSGAKHAGGAHRSAYANTHLIPRGNPLGDSARYHELPPRSTRQVRRFVRFLSSNLGRVSVNHN